MALADRAPRYIEPKEPLPDPAKVLECLLCKERYSQEDIKQGLYQISTFICSTCYRRRQRMPYEKSCFGKPSIIFNGKYIHYGYSEEQPECKSLCPDRIVCRRIAQGQLIVEVDEQGAESLISIASRIIK